MSKKYPLPEFLQGKVTQAAYVRWLGRKSIAHKKRDKKRGNSEAVNEAYKMAIHAATADSGGFDEYTGEPLHWELISTYDNEKSKTDRRKYKATLDLLPTVDHVGDGLGEADFKICGWRTNDAKSAMTLPEFIELCRRVVAHSERGQAERQR
jgi:hypothetical protein